MYSYWYFKPNKNKIATLPFREQRIWLFPSFLILISIPYSLLLWVFSKSKSYHFLGQQALNFRSQSKQNRKAADEVDLFPRKYMDFLNQGLHNVPIPGLQKQGGNLNRKGMLNLLNNLKLFFLLKSTPHSSAERNVKKTPM